MPMAEENAPKLPLTPDQWAGLAHLGDMALKMRQLLEVPGIETPMATLVLQAAEWNTRYGMALVPELLETLEVLRKTGGLRWIRENADYIFASATLLEPLVPQILEALRKMPIAEVTRLLGLASALLSRIEAALEFFEGPAGEALVQKAAELGALWEETRVDESLIMLLRLFRRIGEDGNWERLASLSSQIGLFLETVDLDALAGQLVQEILPELPALPVAGAARAASRLLCALEEAMASIVDTRGGGIGGLYHLLKDPEVQRGLRLLALLPACLEKAGLAARHAA